MPRTRILHLLIPLLLMPLVQATTVRMVNLPDMASRSDRIFFGQCLSAEVIEDTDRNLAYTEYRFRVIEEIKGVRAGEEVVFRQFLGFSLASAPVVGIPGYRVGEKLLLFLAPDSRLGLTSPSGLQQGAFRQMQREGQAGFLNGAGNRNLAFQLSSEEAREMYISPDQLEILSSGKPVTLDQIRGVVEGVQRFQDERARRIQ